MTKLRTHARTEANYAKREKMAGAHGKTLRPFKRAAHKEERRNARELIAEQLKSL